MGLPQFIRDELTHKVFQLSIRKQQMVNYLMLKIEAEDWCAVVDITMDIRDVCERADAINDCITLLEKKSTHADYGISC